MDWRQPSDDFGCRLTAARAALLANAADPWQAVEQFEPILEELHSNRSSGDERIPRLRGLGRESFEALRASPGPVAMEVRHFCWHLQHLVEAGPSNVKDMLLIVLTRFAHGYPDHPVDRCPLCAEYPNDLPYQGRTGGREHFHDWLRQGRRETTA